MSRYIDADALKDWSEIVPLTGDGGIDINDFDEILASMPTADVAPVRHGRWAIHSFMPHTKYCSECEADSPYNKRWDFCPNCGAKNGGEV